MINENTIRKIQEKYKDIDIYSYEIGEDFYMYRLITKKEYHYYMSAGLDELELQDIICNTCILYPEKLDIDDMLAGDVTELAKLIISQSCVDFSDRKTLIEMYREEMIDLDNEMICIIIKAFPAYKIEDIENMDYPTFYKLYTRAEWLLQKLEHLDIVSFLDPVESFNAVLNPTKETHTTDEENIPKQIANEELTKKESNLMGRNLDEVLDELQNKTSHRKQMSPEELRAFQQKFPEMNMQYDAMFTGFETMRASTTAPGLRTPGEL